ncbi:DNA-formamidopyrimidine glycosylase [Moraxella caviae]|uniref:Formamidopyrimidine-DNA glycosylase n=1 Tax=Moraxella caviae TaxID=34060 RepID=A0A1S9ZVC4_9GAMM|nr:bifunctional DNA-formamidopyrimidine glycosylase/DNA-(apurinic or apyrimidinic site) lyase [Moraxella caviae]OOR87476.1 DNA-formamidopyrimidine glycosylase [Moraxella caviae]STZ10623.1 Formamidopyrimidine-DNA glycosylase [Moraxella caviae]
MPELPEVETTKASLAPLLGECVQSVAVHQPKLREMMPPDLPSLVSFRLIDVRRRAKYLLLDFVNSAGDDRKTLLIHLGMSGSLQQHPAEDGARKHDHLLFTFANGTALHYHDPRRFGIVVWAHNDAHIDTLDGFGDKYLAHLGVEPLDDEFTGEYLYHYIQRLGRFAKLPKLDKDGKPKPSTPIAIKKPIKTVIMDQTCVVGVGNIYAAESLFLSGIHPATPAHLLDFDEISTLAAHIKDVLGKAIIQGGTTLKDFTVGEGKTGYFQQVLLAYGRDGEPCENCRTPLENIKIGGRASVYCPKCQPLKS